MRPHVLIYYNTIQSLQLVNDVLSHPGLLYFKVSSATGVSKREREREKIRKQLQLDIGRRGSVIIKGQQKKARLRKGRCDGHKLRHVKSELYGNGELPLHEVHGEELHRQE